MMEFAKKPLLVKLWLKWSDRKRYSEYKKGLNHYKVTQNYSQEVNNFLQYNQPLTLKRITEWHEKGCSTNFSHSGNAGDIIYSLAALKSVEEKTSSPISLFLRLDRPLDLPLGFSHPLGNVMLNQKMADMLLPLLKNQSYLKEAAILDGQKVLLDFDLVRASGIKLDRGSIARWYCYLIGGIADLTAPWIEAKPDLSFADKIIIARSSRYQNSLIDYSFLAKYDNLEFVGIESEYNELRKNIPNLRWLQVPDFLRLAEIIAGCKFFIGNQSFPFSLAEGLKRPRILETYFNAPNVIPEGRDGYDFYFQEHFESLVKYLNEA
ncbi:MAG: hypothetical protein K0S09_1680 [Sphingobacteriaceae bacterium]|jgi:hypothetical protein|nr:hypothetical protein [Sphingobacteriaceae bacterium]